MVRLTFGFVFALAASIWTASGEAHSQTLTSSEIELRQKIQKMSDSELSEMKTVYEDRIRELLELKEIQRRLVQKSPAIYRGGPLPKIQDFKTEYDRLSVKLNEDVFSLPIWDRSNPNAENFIDAIRGVDARIKESLRAMIEASEGSEEFFRGRAAFDLASTYSMVLSQLVLENREGGDAILIGTPRQLLPLGSKERKEFLEVMIRRAAALEQIRSLIFGEDAVLDSPDDIKTYATLYQDAIQETSWLRPIAMMALTTAAFEFLRSKTCKSWIRKLTRGKLDQLSPRTKKLGRWAMIGLTLGLGISFANSAGDLAARSAQGASIEATPYDRVIHKILATQGANYKESLTSTGLLREFLSLKNLESQRSASRITSDPDRQAVQSRWGSLNNALDLAHLRLRLIHDELSSRIQKNK